MKLRLNDPAKELTGERFAEAVRECGVLWLVFSILDRLLTDELTIPWAAWNISASVAVWVFGMYIELRVKKP